MPQEVDPRLLSLFRRHWGYPELRPGQEEVLREVMSGAHVLGVLPTGAGKSVCYQLPAMLEQGLTVVVSPLISLMLDQVQASNKRGIPAVALHGGLSYGELERRYVDIEAGRYKLLYLSPERLKSETLRVRGSRFNVRRIAVDEAHCISEWGHDFRPEYRVIPKIYPVFGKPQVVAFTATATPDVRDDILRALQIPEAEVIVQGFDRPNLYWQVIQTTDKPEAVLSIAADNPGAGIIYTSTRKSAEGWSRRLSSAGVTAEYYHAGLDSAKRAGVQNNWMTGKTRVIVATTAFGMGIDKPDVRWVIHVEPPLSIESYYQEAGRAGRDGKPALAVALWSPGDDEFLTKLAVESKPDMANVVAVYQAVCNLGQVAYGETPVDPLRTDIQKVAGLTGLMQSRIEACLQIMERSGTMQIEQAGKETGAVRCRASVNNFREYANRTRNKAVGAFVEEIIRILPPEAFYGWAEIHVPTTARKVRLTVQRFDAGMYYLQDAGLLEWRPSGSLLNIKLLEARSKVPQLDERLIRSAIRRAEMRAIDMLRYVHAVGCRRRYLLSYFGEPAAAHCGYCDLCSTPDEEAAITDGDEPALRQILSAILSGVPLADLTELSRSRLNVLLGYLVQQGYITPISLSDQQYSVTERALEYLDQWQPRS